MHHECTSQQVNPFCTTGEGGAIQMSVFQENPSDIGWQELCRGRGVFRVPEVFVFIGQQSTFLLVREALPPPPPLARAPLSEQQQGLFRNLGTCGIWLFHFLVVQ